MKTKMPTFFISHGGGPCFWMEWNPKDLFSNLEKSLVNFQSHLPYAPKAIVVISAHWETDEFALQAKPEPGMLYDYYGFPEHTYQLKYPAKGSTELALEIIEKLKANNINAVADYSRDYDHGLFVPMLKMFPNPSVPVLQLSIKKNYSPLEHYELGRALSELRDEGVLIIGSGYSYHNLREFHDSEGKSHAFDKWLRETMTLSGIERKERLLNWESAPNARFCHPQEDHLVPLFVIAGAAENEAGETIYHERMKRWEFDSSSFMLG